MEPSSGERCICQICTCGRHRCRKHPQQATLNFGAGVPTRTRGSLELHNASLAAVDYTLSRPNERPVVKKLVDNLQVSSGALEASTSQSDYQEFHPNRPVIHRLTDQLTTSGDFATTSVSQDQYVKHHVKRPEGGRKLRSSLRVRGHLEAVPTNRDYQDHENYVRPTLNRIPDKIGLESDALEGKSVSNRDYRKFSVERPVIRRLQSSLKIAPGTMEENHSLSQDTYRELPVSRPKRHLLADQLTSEGEMLKTSNHQDDYREFSVERPIIKKLQDNLSVATLAKFDAQPTQTDYSEHLDYSKPVRKRMEDTLKFSGEMEQASQSRKDYVEFRAERPIIKKLVDNIPVHPANGNAHQHLQSTQRDYGHVESKRPVINKLTDNLKMEGHADLQTAYKQNYVQKQESVRPEIKRMNSNLAVAQGDFATASVVKTDYPEHHVSRPTIMKPTNQLHSNNDSSWNTKPRAAMRPSNQEFSLLGQPHPVMSRARQMQSSIEFGHQNGSTGMTSVAQETYVPLEGAQKSRMLRPRTSNRLQDWNNANGSNKSRNGHLANIQEAQPIIQRDQGASRKKHQVTDSSIVLDQQAGREGNLMNGSLYKKSFTLPAIESCPAAVLHVDEKSNYKFTREWDNHRFYKPIK